MNKIVSGTLAADVANTGTFTVSYPNLTAPEYPSGFTDAGYFLRTRAHKIMVGGAKWEAPAGFALTFNASNITVTNRSGSTWRAGSPFVLELQEPGKGVYADLGMQGTGNRIARMARADAFIINLGSPDAVSANAIAAAQTFGAAGDFVLSTGSNEYVCDVPRAISATVATSDHSARVITVFGFDEYGAPMADGFLGPNNNTVISSKCFKRVTRVTVNGAVATNGISIGISKVLGLPVFLPAAAFVLREIDDGVTATAGTINTGSVAAGGSTLTTADVRGRYTPNGTPDGVKHWQLIVALPDPGDIGMPQFAG